MNEAGPRVTQATRQRAAIYAHLLGVLRKTMGESAAVAAMTEAIYNFGKEKATKSYSDRARGGDLRQAAREFSSPDPVKRYQFAPRIVEAGESEALIAMSRCPLADQWRESGLPPDEVALLCRIARAVDSGAWEGALGFSLTFEGTRGEGESECLLRIRKRRPGAAR